MAAVQRARALQRPRRAPSPPARSRASASANGASRRWSCSTTVTPSKARQAGVTIEASAGARSRVTPTPPPSWPGPWPTAPRDRVLHLAGEGARLLGPAAGRRNRIEHGDADVARRRSSSWPLRITKRLPSTATGTTGRPASIAIMNVPARKRRQRAVEAAGALREDDQRVAGLHQAAHLPEQVGAGVLAIDEHVAGPRQVPAEERKAAQRRLGQDAQLEVGRSRTAPECRRCSGGSTANT